MSDTGDADDGDDAADETLMSETEAREFFEERAFQVSLELRATVDLLTRMHYPEAFVNAADDKTRTNTHTRARFRSRSTNRSRYHSGFTGTYAAHVLQPSQHEEKAFFVSPFIHLLQVAPDLPRLP